MGQLEQVGQKLLFTVSLENGLYQTFYYYFLLLVKWQHEGLGFNFHSA